MTEALRDKATIANAAEAVEWIAQAQFNYRNGVGPYLLAESLELARRFKVDEGKVNRDWLKTDQIRETLAKKISPSLQPEVEDAAEPEGELVLSKLTPMLTAREFAQRRCRQQGFLATYFYNGDFWKWNGCHYRPVGEEEINAEIYAFLDGAKVAGVGAELTRFQLKPSDAEAVLKCLKAGLVSGLTQAQCWLDTKKPAPSVIAFRNYLVDYVSGEVSALSPRLWITDGVNFDFDRHARCPRWEQFLEEVFPGDAESQMAIEEQLGYGMTTDMRFEKGALWIGKKRSGKSTIAFVLKSLVGERSHIGLSFHTWLKGENSGSAMIGKKAGVFADVRLKPSVHYGKVGFDPGEIDHVSAEALLKIIGRDTVSLGEKYARRPWEGELWIKFYILSNEVPNLQDAGGVLASRFIKLAGKVFGAGRTPTSAPNSQPNSLGSPIAVLPPTAGFAPGAASSNQRRAWSWNARSRRASIPSTPSWQTVGSETTMPKARPSAGSMTLSQLGAPTPTANTSWPKPRDNF
jgi:D5-like protein